MNWRKKLLLIVILMSLMMMTTGCGVLSDDQRVNEMFLSGGSMYYTNYKDTIYRYDNLSGKGKVVSKLNIRNASQVFEDKEYIYYSNGSDISRKSLSDGSTVRLVKGENISVGMISGSSLVYASAQRDVNGKTQLSARYPARFVTQKEHSRRSELVQLKLNIESSVEDSTPTEA